MAWVRLTITHSFLYESIPEATYVTGQITYTKFITHYQWDDSEQEVKVIWHKAASPPHTDHSIVFARWRQCASHLIHGSSCQHESESQTSSGWVHPFCEAHAGDLYRHATCVAVVCTVCCALQQVDQLIYIVSIHSKESLSASVAK